MAKDIKIAAIGGGTGLPVLLRGLKHYTGDITAIVTVADDGGSSGKLTESTGMLPPGDFRNNIAALSESEELFQLLLQYRFGDKEGLGGHAFGNLLITAMSAIYGSFEDGILNTSRVLAVRGRVLPSTLEAVTLCAEVATNEPAPADTGLRHVRGESNLSQTHGRIRRLSLDPIQARAFPGAIEAILRADLIVAGPGSFFTSTMPNLIVEGIRAALLAAKAPKVFVANILNQEGETDGFTLVNYLQCLDRHGLGMFTHVVVNNRCLTSGNWPNLEWIQAPAKEEHIDAQCVEADLIDDQVPWRHDSRKLARTVMAMVDA